MKVTKGPGSRAAGALFIDGKLVERPDEPPTPSAA
jgi:hypothetical protein